MKPEAPSRRWTPRRSDSGRNHESWQLWKHPRRRRSESTFARYSVAILLPIAAAVTGVMRPALGESPFFLFLGAVGLVAAQGGIAPAFISTAISALILRVLFIHPVGSVQYGIDLAGMERMTGFVLLAMLLSSFVAALRRECNQLRDSEERYRLLAETASDAIIVIDEQGEILYVNPVAEKTFGTRADQLLGRNLAMLLPGDGYHEQLTELKRHVDSRKKAVAVQLPGLHQSGEHLVVEMTLGASSSHRGRDLFTAIIRDLTARPGKPKE